MYTHTERRTVNGERVEQIMQLNTREYLVCVRTYLVPGVFEDIPSTHALVQIASRLASFQLSLPSTRPWE